ncbi:Protein CBG13363 [Caenorhabditis briggsae]|uniref:Protein CBG13363 n=1 Tax=Caenorhabditis briggsae TaxID=6238 RepID=A8XHY1_CAEBR|nr:Protein CBG13363 [Caenorhabditis briggsae]CAP32247.1 Protein CBG13363 [Caenorhabditis briggsae]
MRNSMIAENNTYKITCTFKLPDLSSAHLNFLPIIGQFSDSWGRSNLPNCLLTWDKYTELNTIFTSEYSTDESIRFGLRLMSTFVYAERYRPENYWNWMREMSEGVRNNQKWTKNTRESASDVLYEIVMSDTRWNSY